VSDWSTPALKNQKARHAPPCFQCIENSFFYTPSRSERKVSVPCDLLCDMLVKRAVIWSRTKSVCPLRSPLCDMLVKRAVIWSRTKSVCPLRSPLQTRFSSEKIGFPRRTRLSRRTACLILKLWRFWVPEPVPKAQHSHQIGIHLNSIIDQIRPSQDTSYVTLSLECPTSIRAVS